MAIPHQTNYSDLFLSPPPAKTKKWRIGLAHGTVTGMSFTGLDEETEDGGSYLDPSLIQTLDLDYLAIGHLHSTRGLDLGNCKIRYAGSSRVWRKSEFGERGGFIIQIREDVLIRNVSSGSLLVCIVILKFFWYRWKPRRGYQCPAQHLSQGGLRKHSLSRNCGIDGKQNQIPK